MLPKGCLEPIFPKATAKVVFEGVCEFCLIRISKVKL
jgi:hypothetical protein